MNETLWSVEDLSEFLGKPTSWVYDNHTRERIPSFRIGQQLRFYPHEVRDWVESACRLRA